MWLSILHCMILFIEEIFIMSYKIVLDSCGELPAHFREAVNTEIVPLNITVDDYCIADDELFNQAELISHIAKSPNSPKSSCPSPERFMEAMEGDADRVYVITLSSELSGSYNSARLAMQMYLEDHEDKQIHVFDSKSASCGQTQIAYWIREFEEAGLDFEKIVEKCNFRISLRRTYFVLDNLETLRKNGRLSNIKSFVANTLNIKPVMAGTILGTITQAAQARGIKKALSKMVDISLEGITNTEERLLMISHCNCLERAQEVVEEYKKKAKFKDTLILDTRGISTMYANDGGIIVTL